MAVCKVWARVFWLQRAKCAVCKCLRQLQQVVLYDETALTFSVSIK